MDPPTLPAPIPAALTSWSRLAAGFVVMIRVVFPFLEHMHFTRPLLAASRYFQKQINVKIATNYKIH